ncbi:MAG TPA: hypothetical protein PKJ16_18370, partial [Spirochaetota bacterium]|nr:hypothetical protein [Spirochaetota bacterium]
MYLIKKSDVLRLAEELGKTHDLYGPFMEPATKQAMFERVGKAADIDLAAPIPALPPKHALLPHYEKILAYSYDKKTQKVDLAPIYDDRPKALFGVRPCDLTGILCLDRFFLGQEFLDEVYKYHRKNLFIVSQTCVAPFKQCFCVCCDGGPAASEGYDLNLTDLGDTYLVEAGSEKGKKLAEAMGLAAADAKHQAEKTRRIDKCITLFDSVATDNKAWISRVMNRVTTG